MKMRCLIPLLFASTAWAGTYTAATCSQADVNAVINGPTHTAVNGDVIIIPSGTCTWATGVSISNIGIDITGTGTPNTGAGTVGAGSSNTTLIDNASAPFFAFTGLTYGQTAKVELLNMSAAGAGSNTINSGASFYGTCTTSGCAQIRVDNINFTANTWESALSGGMVTADNVFGVVDHNTSTEPVSASPPLVQVSFDAWQGVGTYGDNSFASADTLGTAQAMYMENNLLSGVRISENDVPPIGGSVGGARYVCRFNTVSNMSGTGICNAHGTAWGGRFRGVRQIESYYNTVTTSAGGCNAVTGIDSGTGYFLSNSVNSSLSGSCNEFLELDITRFVNTSTPWNHCDGTQPWDQSPWSSTTACLDQPGSGLGTGLENLTPVLVTAPGTACTTSGQCWPNPVSVPIYEAGEVMTAGGLGSPVYISADGTSTRVLLNRDVYAEVSQSAQSSATSPFNGTTGTGYGTLAFRPTTCTTGVGYWATDQGTWNNGGSGGVLYTCVAGAWSLTYTPYTYPHPLDTGTLTAPTASPVAGTYSGTQTVTLSASAGATICYTINGATPTAGTAGTCDQLTYSTPLTISSTTTVKALATEASFTNSSVASFLYTITGGSTTMYGGTVYGGTIP